MTPPTTKNEVEADLHLLGCPDPLCHQIANGSTIKNAASPWLYIAGKMRGLPENNHSAFDAAKGIALDKGYNVISPADIDHYAGKAAQVDYFLRDMFSLYFLANLGPHNGILLMPGWCHSVGAASEFFSARWLELRIFRAVRHEIEPCTTAAMMKDFALTWVV